MRSSVPHRPAPRLVGAGGPPRRQGRRGNGSGLRRPDALAGSAAPHDDVAKGNFRAAEFAADLAMVARGEGDPEYTDPVEFFRRTFLTGGLSDLITRAVNRLSGDMNASPVINLQTNFGGGKTTPCWRCGIWPRAPGNRLPAGHPGSTWPRPASTVQSSRVALVGNHLEPSGLKPKPDGTKVNTLWGELAWQLGGREAYEIVAEADRTSTNPATACANCLSSTPQPSSHRRVGCLRPPALRPRRPARWQLRHTVHLRSNPD